MKKILIMGISMLLLSSPVALAGYGLLSTLSFSGSVEIDSPASYCLLSTLSFGGSAKILENSCPESSGFSIENGTTTVVIIPHP
jgi:type 1 fimbria pilin